jgi:RNA polymerase sigma factor (sigma-70 family)
VSALPDADTSSQSMAALARGSHAGLEALMAAWQTPLHRFIYRYVQDEAAAEDLTQETFVRIYQHRLRFRPDTSFACWAFSIAANLCRNHRRWRWRHRTDSFDGRPNSPDTVLPCTAAGPHGELVAFETSAAVRAAINAPSSNSTS